MKLHFRKIGEGKPLIILHGLYGSGDNWYSIARELSHQYCVYLPDQRNHGSSPHDPEMNYEVLTRDLLQFIDDEHLEKVCLMGHSMGGKVGLLFTMKFPERVERLIVVDISLRNYNSTGSFHEQASVHQHIIDALTELDIDSETRTEIDDRLSAKIDSKAVRQFLLKNLKRSDDGSRFVWQLNLLSLADNLELLMDNVAVPGQTLSVPLLAIGGQRSGYIDSDDIEEFRKYFTDFRIEMLNTGHWVHAEEPELFISLIRDFLSC